ncbi:hypothetical protein MTO96_051999, partial [Rhipicephalus appendiculatus]
DFAGCQVPEKGRSEVRCRLRRHLVGSTVRATVGERANAECAKCSSAARFGPPPVDE